ncbi:uncharacterized protein LOC101744161 isoform X2 [Bombyx mori]|uniref:uncharacterized protein LOC101744161 isoform X2 n=1 Tax=Bombyx mori TaxID=7091 RepID=UPI000640A8CA
MVSARSLAPLCALVLLATATPLPRSRRQLADDDALQPLQFQSGTTWSRRTRALPSEPSSSRGRRVSPGVGLRAHGETGGVRVTRQADDIPVFDRNKVSLDFPGSLFGPSVSLLIRTTKIIGDVVQNSAVRYQSFLRLFRPLFRGPFEIKGLDPPTTTTTTTTTTTAAPPADTTPSTTPAPAPTDNEVRRR